MSEMNILLIPTWYPNRYNPITGIFCKEQALAIAAMRPDWKIAISLWGQQESHLAFGRFRQWPQRLVSYARNSSSSLRKLGENIYEYKDPVLTWHQKFMQGNFAAVVKANLKNLDRARREFGSIHIIHAHVAYPAGRIAMELQETTGIPFVLTEHMSPFPFPEYLHSDGSLKEIVKAPLQEAKAVIAVSPSLKQDIQRYGIENVETIPNVVNEDFFKPSTEKRTEGFQFFTLAHLVSQKGIPDLLRAIALFTERLKADDRLSVEFRIGGDGNEGKTYKSLATSLKIDRWVKWLGLLSHEQALKEYQSCDCFVLPSHHETFGIVLAEATACGKPVIATRCGGPENIVTPENGLLVEPRSPAALAEALRKMFETARAYDSSIIRRQFTERFSRAVVVSLIEQVYKRVLVK